jgi:hypothetical protein
MIQPMPSPRSRSRAADRQQPAGQRPVCNGRSAAQDKDDLACHPYRRLWVF